MAGNKDESIAKRTRQPVQVLVYPFRLTGWEWEYLLLQRLPERGGFWQGVTGGVESKERLEDTARRELIEETGLYPIVLQNINHSYTFPVERGDVHLYPEAMKLEEHVFYAQVDGESQPILDPREHNEFRWCGYKEALGLLHWPENKNALTAVENHLSKHRAKHSS
jgi:8-oxo-dGTP pyrophosphatase MutT (NUDIX family)